MSGPACEAPGAFEHAEGEKLKPSQASPVIVAQAVLAEYYPGGTLLHFHGDFYQWWEHTHNGGYFSKMPRRALAPFVFKTLESFGRKPSTPAIREVVLALSAITLSTERPRPDFAEAQWARAGLI